MTMKKILNEWRSYTITETNQPLIDQQLGAPEGWFGTWDDHLGIFQTQEWMDYVNNNYPNLESDLLDYYDKDEVFEIKKSLYGGLSFYTIEYLGVTAFRDLMKKKLDSYFNSPTVSEEHKAFFRDNFERIMDWGRTNAGANRAVAYTKDGIKKIFDGTVSFMATPTDWYAFGDGFGKTYNIMEDMISKMQRGKPTPTPEFEPPKPPSPEMEDRLAQMRAAMERFYGGK